MAWWTNFISSVQLFPSRARPPRGQMAPKQLLVSQYIWRHSWNDNSDGATSSSYTKALFRTFPLVLVCYKQNLMCENKIKASPFPTHFVLAAFVNATLCLPYLCASTWNQQAFCAWCGKPAPCTASTRLTVLGLLNVPSRLRWAHWSLCCKLEAQLGNYLWRRTMKEGSLGRNWNLSPMPNCHDSIWVRLWGWPGTFGRQQSVREPLTRTEAIWLGSEGRGLLESRSL